MISIIVTITFTNTRGNRAAVIKHGPRTSTPCILPAALVFIFASTSSTTSNLLLSATRVPRCRTQQPCRPVGVTCKPNVYPVLTAGSSTAAQPHPLAARRDSPAGFAPLFFALVYLHRFCYTVISSPGCPSNQYASLSSILLSNFKCLPFSFVTQVITLMIISAHYSFSSRRGSSSFLELFSRGVHGRLSILFLVCFLSFRHLIVSPRLGVSVGIGLMMNTISCKWRIHGDSSPLPPLVSLFSPAQNLSAIKL